MSRWQQLPICYWRHSNQNGAKDRGQFLPRDIWLLGPGKGSEWKGFTVALCNHCCVGSPVQSLLCWLKSVQTTWDTLCTQTWSTAVYNLQFFCCWSLQSTTVVLLQSTVSKCCSTGSTVYLSALIPPLSILILQYSFPLYHSAPTAQGMLIILICQIILGKNILGSIILGKCTWKELQRVMKITIFLSKSKIRLNTTKPNHKDCEYVSKLIFLTKEYISKAKYLP